MVLGAEFGLVLKINDDNDGRDHQYREVAWLLVGADIESGRRRGTLTATTSMGPYGKARS